MTTANSTLEPQTAEYQATVDNVWFEISQNAREIMVSWAWGNSRVNVNDRIDYITRLEMQMERALGRKQLGYCIENF